MAQSAPSHSAKTAESASAGALAKEGRGGEPPKHGAAEAPGFRGDDEHHHEGGDGERLNHDADEINLEISIRGDTSTTEDRALFGFDRWSGAVSSEQPAPAYFPRVPGSRHSLADPIEDAPSQHEHRSRRKAFLKGLQQSNNT